MTRTFNPIGTAAQPEPMPERADDKRQPRTEAETVALQLMSLLAVYRAYRSNDASSLDVVSTLRPIDLEAAIAHLSEQRPPTVPPYQPPMVYDPKQGVMVKPGTRDSWIEEELKDGDRLCSEAKVERTEGGRLPVAKIINALREQGKALAPSARGEPKKVVAWLHRHHTTAYVITETIKQLWLKAKPEYVENYTVPLYFGDSLSAPTDDTTKGRT